MATAFCRWTPPAELLELFRDTERRTLDLSVAMEQISRIGSEEIVQRLIAGGDGDWPALSPATILRSGNHRIGIGEHGGFVSTIRRDFSRRNAVVFSRAPHAHLFDEGTKWHAIGGQRVRLFNEGGRHLSRGETRRRLTAQTASGFQQPPRPFMYFSDRIQARFGQIIVDHVLPSRIAA